MRIKLLVCALVLTGACTRKHSSMASRGVTGTHGDDSNSEDVTSWSCDDNQVQVGMEDDNGQLVPQCRSVPTCGESESLSFNGSSFSCKTNSVSIASAECGSNEVMYGMNADLTPKCRALAAPSDP